MKRLIRILLIWVISVGSGFSPGNAAPGVRQPPSAALSFWRDDALSSRALDVLNVIDGPGPRPEMVRAVPSESYKFRTRGQNLTPFEAIPPVPLEEDDIPILLKLLVEYSEQSPQAKTALPGLSPARQRNILDAEIDLMNFLNAPWVDDELLRNYGLTPAMAVNVHAAVQNVVIHSGTGLRRRLSDFHVDMAYAKMARFWQLLLVPYRAGTLGQRAEGTAWQSRRAPRKSITSSSANTTPARAAPPVPGKSKNKEVVDRFLKAFKKTFKKQEIQQDVERFFIPSVSIGRHGRSVLPEALDQFLTLALAGFKLPLDRAAPFVEGRVVGTVTGFGIVQWDRSAVDPRARVIPLRMPDGERMMRVSETLTPVVLNDSYKAGDLKSLASGSNSREKIQWHTIKASILIAASLLGLESAAPPRERLLHRAL